MSGIVVTLGAGHGGHDLGTVGPSGFAEKDFTLAAARQAARWLAAGPFEPALLRAGDWYADTPQRARMAATLRCHCHVELHADLSKDSPKGAAVWFSAYRPKDRLPAAELSRRIARVCRVPDCGARPRYDYGALLSLPAGTEDYYAVLERMAGPENGPAHVFYCECGLPESVSVSGRRLRQTAARLAWETARAVAGLFETGVGSRLRPPAAAEEEWRRAVRPVRLRGGRFYARAGPGPRFPAVGIVGGGILTDCLAERDGWFAIPGEKPRSGSGGRLWLSALALAEPTAAPPPQGPQRVETTRRSGFSLVLAEPQPGAAVLGAVGPGTKLPVFRLPGYRRIAYNDREAFLSDDSFLPD